MAFVKKLSILLMWFIPGCNLHAQHTEEYTLKYQYFNESSGYYEGVRQPAYQDSQGFMWFYAPDGLYRFDGSHMELMISASDTINGTEVRGRLGQVSGAGADELWIKYTERNTGEHGLIKYNPASNSRHYRSIAAGSDRLFWINSHEFWSTGWLKENDDKPGFMILRHFDTDLDSVLYSAPVPSGTDMGSNGISDIIVTKDNSELWLSATSGLLHLDTKTGKFTPFAPADLPGFWKYRQCEDIAFDDQGQIWLDYAFGEYLYQFDPITGLFDPIHKKVKNYRFSNIKQIIPCGDKIWLLNGLDELLLLELSDFRITKVLQRNDPLHYIGNIGRVLLDREGNQWVGGTEGVLRIRLESKLFHTMVIPGFNEQFVTNAHARNIMSSGVGDLWVASAGQLYKKVNDKNLLEPIAIDWLPGCGWIISPRQENTIIQSLDEDASGNIWMSCVNCIQKWNPNTNEKAFYWPLDSEGKQREYALFKDMVEDSVGFLWGAGMESGIVRINAETGKEFVIPDDSLNRQQFSLFFVEKLIQTKKGDMFICNKTLTKINVIEDIDPYDVHIDQYELDSAISSSTFFEANGTREDHWIISNITLDNYDIFWIHIKDHGIFTFDYQNNKLTKLDHLKETFRQPIKNIITDLHDRIWFIHDGGLSCYIPKAESTYFFTKSEGIPTSNVVYGNNCVMDKQGWIFVWTWEGIYYFNPEDLLRQVAENPRIVVTNLLINNRKMHAAPNGPIHRDITLQPSIDLKHAHKTISLQYAVLNNYGSPADYRYRYKLEGFDEDWIDAGHRTYLGYSSIPPGAYTLKINASKFDVFDETNEISLPVHMSAAPWLTWWAFTGYGIIILGITLIIVSLYINKERKAQRIILKQNELEKTKEIEKAKTTFFTNISHEFRTPLTLIIDPLRSLLKGESHGEESKMYKVMLNNANKLKVMIDQILTISKIEAEGMALKTETTEVVSFTRQILSNFNSTASSRNIDYIYQSPIESLFASIDRDKYEKIIYNLLSNAFKFTPAGGNVNVKIETIKPEGKEIDVQDFRVIVQDNGIGMSNDKASNIFERFYQINDEAGGNTGSGIGLSIVREFVKIHHGRIEVESEPGKGTKFIVNFPVEQEQQVESKTPVQIPAFREAEVPNTVVKGVAGSSVMPSHIAPLLLIVDDHSDMLNYIKNRLENRYRIIDALNGAIALNLACEQVPDLIVSDVMMPEMDGLELCRKIKQDRRTSHIPIILLTAKADKDSKIEGLEIGADDYVPKPFDMDILMARIDNLIIQREKLSKVFKEDLLLSRKHCSLGNKDEALINQLIEIIEDSIDDPELSVENLCIKIGLSRTQLYRKLLAITNQKPTEFIRTIRLKKAAEMLGNNFGNISEVAYEVGFSNLSYFSESFKKEYGITPKNYQKKHLKV